MSNNPKTFPILTTERLLLRQLSSSDAETIFQLRSDVAINKYLDRKPSKTVADALGFITNILESSESDTLYYWAITLKNEGQLIGTICLFDFSDKEKKCEIGYELLAEFQGKGIMHEAAEAIITFAFQTLELKRIDAVTHKENQQSTKLLKKFSFEKTENSVEENPNLMVFHLKPKK